MPFTYDLNRFGFDKVTRHFQLIGGANKAELERFKTELAQGQTEEIQSAYDAVVTSRSGATRSAMRPFVRADSAGVWQNPVKQTVSWLNDGTGIYGAHHQPIYIAAKRAQYLHFFWKGKEFFRKSVVVKGIKPRRFIEKGIKVFQAGRLRALVRELGQRLAKIARETGW